MSDENLMSGAAGEGEATTVAQGEGVAPADPPASDPPAAPPQRPDFLPEKFWDADTGQPRVETLAKSYTELEKAQGSLKDKLTKEITEQVTQSVKSEYEAAEQERRAKVPASPEEYQIGVPDGTDDVVLLDEPPGEDFKPEPGKIYAVLKQDSPLLKSATTLAHKYGVPQEEFAPLIADLARDVGFTPPTEEDQKAELDKVYRKLGDHGADRVDHAWKGLKAVIGEKADALDAVIGSAEAVEAIEALLEKTGQAKFSPAEHTPQGARHSREELKAMIADERYRNPNHPEHPAYKKQVDEAYQASFS